MKKIKAIMLGIALAGLIGCSTDKDDDKNNVSHNSGMVSCDYIRTKENYIGARECIEVPIETTYGIYKAECDEKNGTFSNGCPAGSVIVCRWKKALLYYYDEMFKGMTCGEIFADDEDTEPDPEDL